MQQAVFMAKCPYEIGDKVEIALIDGIAFTGYPRKAGTALMEITDIFTVHSLKNGSVTFLYELDKYTRVQLVPWSEFTGGIKH